MGIPGVAPVSALIAVLGLCSCAPDVVSLEPIPPPKFALDRARCEALAGGSGPFWPVDPIKRCMKAKGYRFLRQY